MQIQSAFEEYAKIEGLVKSADSPVRSKFIHLDVPKVGERWVYPVPLTADGNAARGLNLPEQAVALKNLGEREGIKLTHGSLQENLHAYRSNEAQPYVKSVLEQYWIYTDELGISNGNDIDVRRVIGAKFVDSHPRQFFVENGENFPRTASSGEFSVMYALSQVLQKGMADEFGYTDRFGVVPVNEDLNDKGKLRWNGMSFDNDGFSAVWCTPYPDEEVLGADGNGRALDGVAGAVVPLWTNENPKK